MTGKIILLDLNYTLVANSHAKRSPFIRQIQIEQYRFWLVKLLADRRVILITARPDKYREITLASIIRKTRWRPEAAFFNDLNFPPPALKKRIVTERIFTDCRWGDEPANPENYFAIESNPATRAVYKALGIESLPVGDQPWTTLPPQA